MVQVFLGQETSSNYPLTYSLPLPRNGAKVPGSCFVITLSGVAACWEPHWDPHVSSQMLKGACQSVSTKTLMALWQSSERSMHLISVLSSGASSMGHTVLCSHAGSRSLKLRDCHALTIPKLDQRKKKKDAQAVCSAHMRSEWQSNKYNSSSLKMSRWKVLKLCEILTTLGWLMVQLFVYPQ